MEPIFDENKESRKRIRNFFLTLMLLALMSFGVMIYFMPSESDLDEINPNLKEDFENVDSVQTYNGRWNIKESLDAEDI